MSELTIRLYEDSQDNIESLYYQSASKIDRLKAELSEAYTELAISIKERIDLGNQLAEANNDLIKHGELCHAAGRGFARDTIKDLERQLDAEAAIRKDAGMTRQQKLDILLLLSALESWGFANKSMFHDYLHDSLTTTMGLLSEDVLQDGKL